MHRSVERILAVVGASAVLVVGIDAVSYAATGSGLVLGHSNVAKKTTTIKNTGSGTVLNLVTKKSSSAPFTTNAQGQVANLNASRLDGETANQIQGQSQGHFALIQLDGTPVESSGGISVTHTLNSGIYCIQVSGVNGSTTPANVTPDYQHDSTTAALHNQAIAEIRSVPVSCASPTAFEVITFSQHVDTGSVGASTFAVQDQPFTFTTPR
jgi:hypothetical protein